jgi:hypothetical protein
MAEKRYVVECREMGIAHWYQASGHWYGTEEDAQDFIDRVSPYTTAVYRIVEIPVDVLPGVTYDQVRLS